MIFTLQGIFTLILIFLILLTILCFIFHNIAIIITIPSIFLTIFILSFCIACPPPPTDEDPGTYGYLDTGDTTYIIPPGKSLFKWPWQKFTIVNNEFGSFPTIEIPTQTTDGMRLTYNINFPVDSVKFDPYKYHTLYNHNYTNYANYVMKRIQPIIDKHMAHVSEADFETGNVDFNAIESEVSAYIPRDGVIWNGPPTYVLYFNHIDNPKKSYACYGVGAGYCAMGDALGLPSAKRSSKFESSIDVEPIPIQTQSYIYINDSNAPSTQEEVNNIIDTVLSDPSYT